MLQILFTGGAGANCKSKAQDCSEGFFKDDKGEKFRMTNTELVGEFFR